jgi:hypothetical protein
MNMGTQDGHDSKGRAALLAQLAAAQERQARLHHALTSLVTEELAVSQHLIASSRMGMSEELMAMISQAVADFRERGAAIVNELRETHKEIMSLLEELRALRTGKP